MLLGYARTSTVDQQAGLEGQLRDLQGAGCEKVFEEQVSSVDVPKRVAFADALDYLREGDTLVVTKLDRLARSMAHMMEVLAAIEAKGANLRILSMDIDTGTATGKLMLSIMGSVAEFERSIMLERQREGIAKAKAKGKYTGRKPTAMAKSEDVIKLHREGIGGSEIARKVGIGRASVYRILKNTA